MVEKQIRSVASVGLVIGSIFGLIGSFVESVSVGVSPGVLMVLPSY